MAQETVPSPVEPASPAEKPIEIPPQTDQPENPLLELRKFLAPTLVFLVVFVGAVSLKKWYTGRAQADRDDAAMLLSSAQTVQDLETLVSKYPGSPLAPLAMLRIAKQSFDDGNYVLAREKYTEVLKAHAGHEFAPAAELGLAHCDEAEGKADAARTAFEAFIGKHPGHFLIPQAVLGQGRCLEALGRLNDAKSTYEDFIAGNPTSEWKQVVEEELNRLNRALTPAQS